MNELWISEYCVRLIYWLDGNLCCKSQSFTNVTRVPGAWFNYFVQPVGLRVFCPSGPIIILVHLRSVVQQWTDKCEWHSPFWVLICKLFRNHRALVELQPLFPRAVCCGLFKLFVVATPCSHFGIQSVTVTQYWRMSTAAKRSLTTVSAVLYCKSWTHIPLG